tara:strand:+ start:102 stop:248 length:147 start_codon:yes stop_codon:yes gene_type:complete
MEKTILTKEQKQEVMKQMKTDSKADFVELVMEMKKKQRSKLNGNTKSN